MNINAFSNMDTFDLSGSVMPPVEGAEPTEDFSGLLAEFTTMLAPALTPPPKPDSSMAEIDVSPEDLSRSADLSVSPDAGPISWGTVSSGDGDPLSTIDFIFDDGPVMESNPERSWSNRFGIERIKSQILEGAIEAPREPAGGLTGLVEQVDSGTELWSGVIDGKLVDGPEPVKNGPRLPPIEPGQTPPIVIINDPVETPVTAPIRTNLVNEFKRTLNEQTPVAPAFEPIRSGRLNGPPMSWVEPIFEPSGVNEAPDVLSTRVSTDGSAKVIDGSVFLGPPQESPELPTTQVGLQPDRGPIRGPLDVYPETGGIKPVRDAQPLADTVDGAFMDAPEPVAIKLTPKFDGTRISGFEINPSDLETVIKTFESYLKPDLSPDLKPLNNAVAKPAEQIPASFGEISDNIRRTLEENVVDSQTRPAGILKAAETIAEIRPVPLSVPVRNRTEPTSVARPDEITSDSVDLPETADVLSRFAVADEKVAPRERQIPLSRPEFIAEFRRAAADLDFAEPKNFNGVGQTDGISATKGNNSSTEVADFAARLFSPEKIVEQVGSRLEELAKFSFRMDERPSIKLRLNPQELGTVEIMIERNENGGLNATFRTETVEAQQALSQNLDTLRETLQNAGWQVGKMDVSTGADFSRGNQQQDSRENAAVADYLKSVDSGTQTGGDSDRDDRLVSLLA